jgi:HEAT repeat protein
VSDLEKKLEEGEIRKAVELVNENEYFWEDLMEFLNDSDENKQRAAYEVVSLVGDHPRLLEALPMLINGLQSDEDGICRYSAEALYHLGTDAVEAAEPLAALLEHDDDEIRRAAARTIVALGSAALDVREKLIDALSDSDEVVRGEAAFAISQLGEEAPEAIPQLITLLGDEEEFVHDGKSMEVRSAAQSALSKIGTEAIPGLLEVLREDGAERRAMAVNTLSIISPLPEGAIADLQEAVEDPDEAVQTAAKNALKRIKSD